MVYLSPLCHCFVKIRCEKYLPSDSQSWVGYGEMGLKGVCATLTEKAMIRPREGGEENAFGEYTFVQVWPPMF
jgi:hypothetical protein